MDNKHWHLTLGTAVLISAGVKNLLRLKLWHIYVLYNDLLENLTNDIKNFKKHIYVLNKSLLKYPTKKFREHISTFFTRFLHLQQKYVVTEQ